MGDGPDVRYVFPFPPPWVFVLFLPRPTFILPMPISIPSSVLRELGDDVENHHEPISNEQWRPNNLKKHRYLKCVDKFFNNYVSCFMTGANVKFLLLHQPLTTGGGGGDRMSTNSSGGGNARSGSSSGSSTSIAANPTSPQTEEAVKSFMLEVYENWAKTVMSPFYRVNMEVRSPVFRQRVAAAGRKYL